MPDGKPRPDEATTDSTVPVGLSCDELQLVPSLNPPADQSDDQTTVPVPVAPPPEPPPPEPVETVTALEPENPFALALTVAVPCETPVTTPLLFTVATLVFVLIQEKVTPEMELPLASRAVATSGVVEPATTEALDGLTTIELISCCATVTVICSLEQHVAAAVTTAVPMARAVIRPEELTVATLVFELFHVTPGFEIVEPEPSRAVALI
jgi:hypothetical protein